MSSQSLIRFLHIRHPLRCLGTSNHLLVLRHTRLRGVFITRGAAGLVRRICRR